MPATAPDPDLALRYLIAPAPVDAAFAAALRACTNVREAAWCLAETAGRTLGLDDCVVYLLDAGSQQLQQVAAWGPKQVAPRIFENPIQLPVGSGIVGVCARDQVPVLVADTRLDARYVVDDSARLSELAVPIRRAGQLVGVIDSEHAACDAYRSEHVRVLLQLGEIFALEVSAG